MIIAAKFQFHLIKLKQAVIRSENTKIRSFRSIFNKFEKYFWPGYPI